MRLALVRELSCAAIDILVLLRRYDRVHEI